MFGRRTTSGTNAAAAATAEAPVGEDHLELAGGNGHAPDDVEQLWSPTKAPARKSVEQLLLERGQITDEQLAQAKGVAAQTPGKGLAQILLQMTAASEAQILSALAETLGI